MDANVHFGLNMIQYRRQSGLSFTAWAEKFNMSSSTVNDVERASRYPHAETVRKFATGLDVTQGSLFKSYNWMKRLYLTDQIKLVMAHHNIQLKSIIDHVPELNNNNTTNFFSGKGTLRHETKLKILKYLIPRTYLKFHYSGADKLNVQYKQEKLALDDKKEPVILSRVEVKKRDRFDIMRKMSQLSEKQLGVIVPMIDILLEE